MKLILVSTKTKGIFTFVQFFSQEETSHFKLRILWAFPELFLFHMIQKLHLVEKCKYLVLCILLSLKHIPKNRVTNCHFLRFHVPYPLIINGLGWALNTTYLSFQFIGLKKSWLKCMAEICSWGYSILGV